MCLHGRGKLARILSVDPSCRSEPGILLTWGRSCGNEYMVSVEDLG